VFFLDLVDEVQMVGPPQDQKPLGPRRPAKELDHSRQRQRDVILRREKETRYAMVALKRELQRQDTRLRIATSAGRQRDGSAKPLVLVQGALCSSGGPGQLMGHDLAAGHCAQPAAFADREGRRRHLQVRPPRPDTRSRLGIGGR